MSDVVVVGGGVAGFAAALAARRAGASVRVIYAGVGASALAGGLWDVAPGRDDEPSANALERVRKTWPYHPYARLSTDLALAREAHALVLEALGIYRTIEWISERVLVATDLGILRRASTAQRSVLNLARLGGEVAVVGHPSDTSFDPYFCAQALSSAAERTHSTLRFGAVSVDWPSDVASSSLPLHVHARAMEDEAVRGRVAAAIGKAIAGRFVAVLVPALLGASTGDVAAAVSAIVGKPTGELATGLASAQSLRLEVAISAALTKEKIDSAYALVRHIVTSGTAPQIDLEGEESLSPRAVVLATGKHLGGGIALRDGRLIEPLAGLPVFVDGLPMQQPSAQDGLDPISTYGDDPFASRPAHRAGVGYDAELRALGRDLTPPSPGLFACGALLDGIDPARDQTGMGVAAITGFLAGRAAAKHALARS